MIILSFYLPVCVFLLYMVLCACACMRVFLSLHKLSKQSVLSKQIDLKGVEPVKGVLLSYVITDLRIPGSYEVRLAPITTYSTGDYITRIIQYSERASRLISAMFFH